jgi:hypothetical protein
VLVSVVLIGSFFFVISHVANPAVAKNIVLVIFVAAAAATTFLFNRR